MSKDPSNFYLTKSEPNKGCLLALRDIILRHNENLTETVKYGMPCFCYHNKMFCYLWVDKDSDEPYILMCDGGALNHPKLEQGTRKRMKIYRVNPNKDIEVEELRAILDEGIAFRAQ